MPNESTSQYHKSFDAYQKDHRADELLSLASEILSGQGFPSVPLPTGVAYNGEWYREMPNESTSQYHKSFDAYQKDHRVSVAPLDLLPILGVGSPR
jgi:hypothetical protein